jgi:hypothetical protein
MGQLMDLIAGEEREIVLALSVDDVDGLADPDRFEAFLSLGGGLDPTWLDMFAEAVRSVTGGSEPRDFLDARQEVDGPAEVGDRTVERVDRAWVHAIALVRDHDVDRVAGTWIALLEDDLGPLQREEKPWIRRLASDIVGFARSAEGAPTVVFAWSL